jgi:aminopeptidase N
MADMWVHESFTNYSESIFLDYFFGKEAGQEYVRGTRSQIGNVKPMIGPYGVNYDGYPGDVYYKGGNMLNTLRTIVNNDEKWRGVLRGLGKTFYHQTVTSSEVESFMATFLGLDLDSFFNQYLRDKRLPTLEYYFKDNQLYYRWMNTISSFDMPIDVSLDGVYQRISPTSRWSSMPSEATSLIVDPNFYISTFKSR